MKTFLKTVSAAALAALSVSAFAAPEEHEEFARQYTPESQAVFERFRKDRAEAENLRASLAEDLRVMNRSLYDDAGWRALSRKILALEARESEWAAFIQDAFLGHTAGLTDAEKLGNADAELAKKTVAWENDALKDLLKNSFEVLGVLVVVKIPGKTYAFGKYEVTQAQYQAVTGENPSRFKGLILPVTNVSVTDASEFCRKLTEWQHACRAGTTTRFYTGDSEEDLARAAWYEGNSGGRPWPVGLKEPNAFGLCDMLGNVGEWTCQAFWTCGGDYGCSAKEGVWESDRYYNGRRSDIGFRVVLTNVQ